VRGRVTEVISGSRKIGGTPTLAMNFNGLELEDGTTVPISGTLVQQAKSDTAKDTAKIVGGTAAGAIIGHQIDDDKGKVIGGILGGAAGAIAARNTGGEIDVPAGTVLGFVLDTPFQVRPN
jgi:outer membrane lipoprotein SlyB